MGNYPNTLDYASTADLKGSKKHNKGTVINKYDGHTNKKACCDACFVF